MRFTRLLSIVTSIALVVTGLVATAPTAAVAAGTTITKTFNGSTWTLVSAFHASNQTADVNALGIRSLFTTDQNSSLTTLDSVLSLTGGSNHYSNSSVWSQINNGYMLEAYGDDKVQKNIVGVMNTANHTWSQLGSATVLPSFARAFTVNSSQLYKTDGTTIPTTYGYVGTSSGTSTGMPFTNDTGDFILLGVTNQVNQGSNDGFDTTFNGATYSIAIGASDGTGTGEVIKNSFTPRGNAQVLTMNTGTGLATHSGNVGTGWVAVWVRGAGPIASTAPAMTASSDAQVGTTWTSTDGTWTGTGTVSLVGRKWQSSTDGSTWTDVAEATASTYTATSGDPGKYFRFCVTQSDTNGSTTSCTAASLVVTTSPLFTASSPATTGTLSTAITNYTFAASGYRITYSIASGALPAGVTLNATTGVLSGTPTASGSFNYEVSATNSSGTVLSGPKNLTINQAPNWTANSPTLSLNTGVSQSYTFTATGYPAPTFTVSSGLLPTGLTLSSSGLLSGIPTTAGTFSATFQASNGIGTAVTIAKTFTVTAGSQAPLVVTPTTTSLNYSPSTAATFSVTTTGGSGTGAISYTVAAGSASVCSLTAIAGTATVTGLAPGACVINVTKASDINYASATGTTTVTFNKAVQSPLTMSATNTVLTYRAAPTLTTTLSTSGGSGTGLVTYAVDSSSSTVCSVSTSTVTVLTAGTCLIIATKATDSTYQATTANLEIIIAKATQPDLAISLQSNLVYSASGPVSTEVVVAGALGAGTKTLTVTSGTCTVSGFTVSAAQGGLCSIRLVIASDSNYLEATTTLDFRVSGATQNPFSLAANANSISFNPTVPATTIITATGGSGTGAISFEVASNSISVCELSTLGDTAVVTALTAGDCDVVATKAGDDDFASINAQLTIVISKADQAELLVTAGQTRLTYEANPTQTLELSVSGGSGLGTVIYEVESSSNTVCSITGSTVTILTAGSCAVSATKTSDSQFEQATASMTITIDKAAQPNLALQLSENLTYSATMPATASVEISGVIGTGRQTLTVTQGVCTISGVVVSATVAGHCAVRLNVDADTNYLAGSFTLEFEVAAAQQDALSAALTNDSNSTIGWQASTTTTYSISGGSGIGALTATSSDAGICTASLNASQLTITGLAGGNCSVTITKAADTNHLSVSTTVNVSVKNLPSNPRNVALSSTGTITTDGIAVTATWNPAVVGPNDAVVTGYEIQTKNGANWERLATDPISADTHTVTFYVTPWTAMFVRVAAITALDEDAAASRNWANFTGGASDSLPVAFNVAGSLVNISTSVAAATSGELVTVTGSGFDQATTNQVKISTASSVFAAAGIGAAAVTNTKTVNATVISPTRISFFLPTIKMPAGVTRLAASVRVLSTSGVQTPPVTFNYIPKKLSQTLALSAPMPSSSTSLVAGIPLVTNTVATSNGIVPVITASPSNVCSASVNQQGKIVINPIGKGSCSVSIQAPASPGYTPSAVKTSVYKIAGIPQTIIGFSKPADRAWSTDTFEVSAEGSTGLEVVFSSATPSVCSITNAEVTMNSAGTCIIAANQSGDATTAAATTVKQSFVISKAVRLPGFSGSAENIADDGTRSPASFSTVSDSAPTVANLNVVVGDDPLDIPVTLNPDQGTVTFTVNPADEAAGRCTAESPSDISDQGLITISDVGSCRVTVSQVADSRYLAGASFVILVNAVALSEDGVAPGSDDHGDAELSPEDFDNNPSDPDLEPAVSLTLDGQSGEFALGGEEGIAYDAATGKIIFKSKTMLVGVWTVKATSPAGTTWFKIPGKVVKKVQQYSNADSCTATLTVKKDAKLKKRVVRIVGAGCLLNDQGKAAFTAPQITKIKISWKRVRQYAKTGLTYIKSGKLQLRPLKKIKRTIVLKLGHN